MQFYQFGLLYFQKKHHKVKIRSKKVTQILFVCFYWQLLSLVLNIQQKPDESGESLNLLNVFYYLYQIGRPYQYLLQYQGFRLYSFSVPTIMILLQTSEFLINWIGQYLMKKSIQINEQKNSHYNDYGKLLSIMFQIHLYAWSLYSIDLFIISIIEAGTNINAHIDVFLISLVFLMLEILLIFINILSSESMHFNSSPLHIDRLSANYFICIILVVLSIFLNNQQQTWKKLINQIFNIFIFGFYISEEVKRAASLFSRVSLIILSYGFVYNLVFMYYSASSFTTNQNYEIVILYILSPLLVNFFFIWQDNLHTLNFMKTRSIAIIYNNLQLLYEYGKESKNFSYYVFQQLTCNDKIDVFSSELELFNNKIIKSKKSCKAFWYQKYILIKHDLMEYTNTLALIYCFKEKLFFSELNKSYTKVQVHISLLQKIQLKMIKEEVYQLLYSNITKHDGLGNEEINQYIHYKIIIQENQLSLLQIFQKKASLYQLMQQGKANETNLVFKQCFLLTQESLQLKYKLQLLLLSYKTSKVYQMIIMLYVDFFNNIIQAEILKNSQTNDQDIKMNILEQMEYLSLSLSEDMLSVQIIDKSSKFFSEIGYNLKTKIKDQQDFRTLFSNEFFETHQQLIQTYLHTGMCQKLLKPYELFLRGFENVYYKVLFQINVQPFLTNSIQFYAFSKVIENQPKIIFINLNNQVVGFTKDVLLIFDALNIEYRPLYLTDANKLIDNFSKLPFEKQTKLFFSQNLSQQIFMGVLTEKLNLIEVEILETQNINFTLEEENQVESHISSFQPNQESLVDIPNNLFIDDNLIFLSSDRRDETMQNLLVSDIKVNPKIIIQSKGNSEKRSESKEVPNEKSKSSLIGKKDDINNDDQASSKFSRGFLDNSIFYSKYNQMELFLAQNNTPFIYFSAALFSIGLLINLVFQIIIFSQLLPQFQDISDDSDLLAIKNNFITPVHYCVTSQQSYYNYLQLENQQLITAEEAKQKEQFSVDSIYKSYDHLKESFIYQLNNPTLQSFFYDQYIQLDQTKDETLQMRNISLKNALYIYLESQYIVTFGSQYENLSTVIQSSNFVYFMSNIVTLDDYFDNLSQSVQQYISDLSAVRESDQTKLFLRLLFLQFLALLLALSYTWRNENIYQRYFSLFTDLNQFAIQLQQQNLNYLITLLKQDNGFQLYTYDIFIWEKKIQQTSSTYNSKGSNKIVSSSYQPSVLKLVLTLLSIAIFFFVPQIIVQYYDSDFYTKYQVSSIWLEKLSETTSAIASVYGLRQTSYMISGNNQEYYFFATGDRIKQNNKFSKELEKIGFFLQQFPQLDFSTMIIDDQTMEVYDAIKNENLCDFLTHFDQSLAQEHCDSIYNGVMKLGLYSSLSEIYNQLLAEYENTNGFDSSLRNQQASFNEMEIGLIASDSISYISDSFFEGVLEASIKIILIHKIFGIINIIVDIILFLYIIFYYLPNLVRQAKIIQNMIYLIPHHQFYLDSKFETNFR